MANVMTLCGYCGGKGDIGLFDHHRKECPKCKGKGSIYVLSMSPLEREYNRSYPDRYIKEFQSDGSLLYTSEYVEWLEKRITTTST